MLRPSTHPLMAIALGLIALPTLSSAASCLIVPKSPAAYEVAEGSFDTPYSTRECRSIRVTNGIVKAMFFDSKGNQVRKEVKAGDTLDVGKATGAESSFSAVVNDFRQLLASGPSQTKPGRKYFDKPEDLGLPHNKVYVPAEGLSFVLKSADGQPMAYRLVDDDSGKLIAEGKGIGGKVIVLEKKHLQSGKLVTLTVNFSGRTINSGLRVADTEDESELNRQIQRIQEDTSLDMDDRRFAMALLFEEFSLGYNRHLVLQGLKK